MKTTLNSSTSGLKAKTMLFSALCLAPALAQAQHRQMAPVRMPSAPVYNSGSSGHSNTVRETPQHSAPAPSTNSHREVERERPAPTRQAAPMPRTNSDSVTTHSRPEPSFHRESSPAPRPNTGTNNAAPRAASGNRASSARTVETRRTDGSRVVSASRSRGFVERPLAARPGFVARTFVVGGRSYARVYRTYAFNGLVYRRYVPALYFSPLFYSWVYNPWATPISFSWGFYNAPWYGYYGAYFYPAPVYTSSAQWLTDFLLAENLKLAYEEQSETGTLPESPDAETAAVSSEIKALLAEEVNQELAAESGSAQGSTIANTEPPVLNPRQRVFVLSMNLTVPIQSGQTCTLTPGDIILRSSDVLSDNGTVAVNVLSSKPGDCPVDSSSAIDLATMQEMHNDFRQQIDSGLALLASNQGKGGLPNGPVPAPRLVPEGQAQPDMDAAEAVLRQQEAALRSGL